MKPLKVLMVLAVVWMGISGTVATTPVTVVCNSIKNTAGEIDYSLSYVNGGGATLDQMPLVTLSSSPTVLSAMFTQGASISNADRIDSYLLARSAGGDVAVTGLDVVYVFSSHVGS